MHQQNQSMKIHSLSLSVLAAVATLVGSAQSASAQSILKSAGNYSILASQAITVAGTGFSIKNGNIGLFPAATTNITGFPPGTVSGITLLGTAAAIIPTGGANQQAEADLQVAATGLAAMQLTRDYSNVDLANLGPLPPGVYRWGGAATQTGALVLDAQGHNNVSWVFQFGTGLTTAINSSVTIINAGSNGGSDDGIFFNAATGAIVIGDNNTVLGNYIAYTSISFTGSTLLLGNGGVRFLALNAAVTFAGPGSVNALGGPGGGDFTGGLTLNGSSVVPAPGSPGSPGTPGAPGSPVVTSSSSASGNSGSTFTPFTVTASGSPTGFTASGLPPGLVINTATGVISGTPTAPGTYVVTITATNGIGSNSFNLTITIAGSYARIANFSARAISGPGSETLIMGFYVSGSAKNILVRGVGPGLAAYGITSPLADPQLALDWSGGLVATNSAWQTNSSGQDQSALITAADTQVGAFPLAAGSNDTALLAEVNQGVYTASIVSPNGSNGVALAEIYDTDTAPIPAGRLMDVSARMNVSPGQGTLIAGLVIAGNIPQTVLIRGDGPSLTSYGVTGALADPVVTVYSGSTQIAANAGWGTGASTAAQLSAAALEVGAFPLPSGSKDSALLVTLQPGAYTIMVTSASGSSGVALVEVYDTQ
jgi:ice-binding like protein/putative Ig domain-containing protein